MNAVVASQVLLNERFVEISYLPEARVVVAKWKGFLTLEQVKRGCAVLNDFIAKHKLSGHLSDHSQLKVLGKEVQDYLAVEWFKQVEALGLRKIAVNLAEDVFAQATVQKVNTQQQKGKLTIESFGSYQSCLRWLNS